MCFAPKRGLDKAIGVKFHGLNLVEMENSLFVMQWLGRVFWAKHNVNNVLVCLNTIKHEPFKLWHVNSICFHDNWRHVLLGPSQGPSIQELKIHIL